MLNSLSKVRSCIGLILLTTLLALVPAAWAQELAIIPWPAEGKALQGAVSLSADTRIIAQDESLKPLAEILSSELRSLTGLTLKVAPAPAADGDIVLALDAGLKNEDYTLSVDRQMTITGANYNAVAMGTVSLTQLVKQVDGKYSIARAQINDGPRLQYTGYLLNTAFEPYSIDTLKQYILYCRFNKIRYFLMTLSGDNGWLFPSKAFPKLGTVSWGWAGNAPPKMYTLDELKDLVDFADAHGVTIVPQFQTLGHSDAMRLAMPETFDLPEKPGGPARLAMVNIANDDVYKAFDTLVGEMCDVFKSSPYFHIGGDETNFSVLEKQPQTIEYLKKHNYPDVYYLMAQHIRRMNEIIKKRGKQTIVWEPILDHGELPKDVIAMPWVGGAKSAERYVALGMRIISAPWGTDKPYHDVYTVNGSHLKPGEPLLLGATALNWGASGPPPVGALMFNEPVYNPQANRGADDFFRRAAVVDPIADKLRYQFTFNATGLLPPQTFGTMRAIFVDAVKLTLDCPRGGDVRYTLDGSAVDSHSMLYNAPIQISDTTTLRARWFSTGGERPGPELQRVYKKERTIKHDAIGAKVTIEPANPSYYNGGPQSITDGFLAATDSSGEEAALGWLASPTITVTFDQPKEVRQLYIHFIAATGAVGLPKTTDIQVSEDGKTFTSISKFDEAYGVRNRGWYGLKFDSPRSLRAVRVVAVQSIEWVFSDELILNAAPPGPTFQHAAFGKPVMAVNPPDKGNLISPPLSALTDGYISSIPDWNNTQWVGFKKDLDATIDLGQVMDIYEVGANFMQHMWARIRIPSTMEVLVSDDGTKFNSVATIHHKPQTTPQEVQTLSTQLNNVRGRYVRVRVPVDPGMVYVNEIFVNPLPPLGGDN